MSHSRRLGVTHAAVIENVPTRTIPRQPGSKSFHFATLLAILRRRNLFTQSSEGLCLTVASSLRSFLRCPIAAIVSQIAGFRCNLAASNAEHAPVQKSFEPCLLATLSNQITCPVTQTDGPQPQRYATTCALLHKHKGGMGYPAAKINFGEFPIRETSAKDAARPAQSQFQAAAIHRRNTSGTKHPTLRCLPISLSSAT
jgi:hypothetical protein